MQRVLDQFPKFVGRVCVWERQRRRPYVEKATQRLPTLRNIEYEQTFRRDHGAHLVSSPPVGRKRHVPIGHGAAKRLAYNLRGDLYHCRNMRGRRHRTVGSKQSTDRIGEAFPTLQRIVIMSGRTSPSRRNCAVGMMLLDLVATSGGSCSASYCRPCKRELPPSSSSRIPQRSPLHLTRTNSCAGYFHAFRQAVPFASSQRIASFTRFADKWPASRKTET